MRWLTRWYVCLVLRRDIFHLVLGPVLAPCEDLGYYYFLLPRISVKTIFAPWSYRGGPAFVCDLDGCTLVRDRGVCTSDLTMLSYHLCRPTYIFLQHYFPPSLEFDFSRDQARELLFCQVTFFGF